jgi:hypothetical protein
MKKGSYGMRVRSAGPPVASARMKLTASRATRTATKPRLRGMNGWRFWGGAPRPSGAGSTRHDGILPSRGCSRSGVGVEEAGLEEGSGIVRRSTSA